MVTTAGFTRLIRSSSVAGTSVLAGAGSGVGTVRFSGAGSAGGVKEGVGVMGCTVVAVEIVEIGAPGDGDGAG